MKPTINSLMIFLMVSPCMVLASPKPHTIGLEIHSGTIDAVQTNTNNQILDFDTVHFMLRYDYQFSEKFSLGLGYLNGDSSDYSSFLTFFTTAKLDYYALLLNAKYQFILPKRNRIYIQASGVQYNYDIIDSSTTVKSEDGFDYGLSLGWAFKFSQGLGLGVGYNYLRLGSDIKIRTVNFGINYSF